MKIVLFLLSFVFSFSSFSQTIKLKKKYQKVYEGTIPSYLINTGNEVVKVGSEYTRLTIKKDSLYLSVGKFTYSGIYKTQKISKKSLSIIGSMEQTGISEELILDTKSKSIVRKGVFPQPTTILNIKERD